MKIIDALTHEVNESKDGDIIGLTVENARLLLCEYAAMERKAKNIRAFYRKKYKLESK